MEPLKNLISRELIESYAKEADIVFNKFNRRFFLDEVLNPEWDMRELRDRINHVAHSFHKVLDLPFDEAISGLEILASKMPTGFEYLVFPTYVEFYGLEHFERAMTALERLTEYSTGEFAVRPFIKSDQSKTMSQMLIWSKADNEHVRRLASEGCRPRLPWGGNLNELIKDPSPIFPILENLKEDESLYVRKSVANNLNDISKDHPDQVLEIAERWLSSGHKYTQWIVKRALRSLLKEANPKALELFGYGNAKHVSVTNLEKDERIKIGDRLDFRFNCKNDSDETQKLRIEYLINYAKKKGSSEKVFQISELELAKGSVKEFAKYQPFHDMTTRKHYPGEHEISIRVNGVIKAKGKFEVVE